MKNTSNFLVLMGSTLVIVFLYIWHHNTLIRYTYQKQRGEKRLEELRNEKERLTNMLLTAQNPHDIKRRAESLGMRPTILAQIRRKAD